MINTELAQIVRQLEQHQPNTRPPLILEQFQAFETALECKFPPEIAQLYLEHDGTDAKTDYRTMFLMPVQEAIERYDNIKHHKVFWQNFEGLTENTRFLWHERNDNYAGLYIDGPLAGKINFYNHEDEDPAPLFRSIESFYKGTLNDLLADKPKGWIYIEGDYPVYGEISPSDAAADLATALSCVDYANTNLSKLEFRSLEGWRSCAVALMPPEETWRLLSEMKGYSITTKIMRLIAKRRYTPATDAIVTWLHHQIDSIEREPLYALRDIGNMQSGQALITFFQQHTQRLTETIAKSLKNCGYEVREVDGGYEYLAPNETTWRKLG